MRLQGIKVALTTRKDGNGVKVKGWYVTDFGIPIGCPYLTREKAERARVEYARDCRRQLSTL